MVDQSSMSSAIQAGTIKVYAIAASERLSSLPDVPTTGEAGVDFIFSAWNAMVAPKGTPKEIVAMLADALSRRSMTRRFKKRTLSSAARAQERGARPRRPAEAGRKRRLPASPR